MILLALPLGYHLSLGYSTLGRRFSIANSPLRRTGISAAF
jgi:hypothetical protein